MSRSRTRRDARRRALAQNFLVDDDVIRDVVGTLHPPPRATIVDLGAGSGALTQRAAADGARVIAVERDPTWVRKLRAGAPGWGAVRVVRGDILSWRFPAGPFHVVSSAPYNIGTQVVRRLLADAHGLVRAVVVLQRETARRLAGTPATGRFAATWAPWFEIELGRTIPARAFRPVPSVESALLVITPRQVPLLSPAAFAEYDAFVGKVFTGRDRTLAERLQRRMGKAGAGLALAAADVPRGATPSALAPADYARLFDASRGALT